MKLLTRLAIVLALLAAVGQWPQAATDTGAERRVLLLTIEEAIGPATENYIERALAGASRAQVELVVIRMDTPGGLDSAMRGIVKKISNADIPVASYVAPSGARAASAGTYILYASHIAAMAPGTNLGAATPVKIGGVPAPVPDEKGKAGQGAEGGQVKDAMKAKLINDAVAYIRGLAALHGRNQDWAEKAVREAASLQAEEALKLEVIDVVATGMGDLLQQLDGREVNMQGDRRALHTAGLVVETMEPDWRSRLLSVITSPNVAYILMLIGIYGLIFEFSNPGAVVPGTVGAIALILALYAFQMLPINYAGMGLILLGAGLMIGEAFAPSFGMLGIGGVIAFVMGSIILMDTEAPGFGIDMMVIATFAVISVLIFIVVIGMAFRAGRRPVVSGMEELVGGEAVVLEGFDRQGTVTIHSETWQAVTEEPLSAGQRVRVRDVRGLILQVEPLMQETTPSTQEKR